jgi:hypothetical protein
MSSRYSTSALCAASIILVALGGCILDGEDKNHPPEIRSLTANPASVQYPDSVAIVVVESVDRDADPLQIGWRANAGRFVGETTEPTAIWQAPEEATVCSVTVVVSDTKDTVEGHLLVQVLTPDTPLVLVDRCPCPRCLETILEFHGELGSLNPDQFWYCWILLDPDGDPIIYTAWIDWVLGQTSLDLTHMLPPGDSYTFRVRSAIIWNDEWIASPVEECRFLIRGE